MEPYQKLALAAAVNKSLPLPPAAKPDLSEQKLAKLKTFSRYLLGALAVAGMITVAVMAPNALQALELFEKRHSRSRRNWAPSPEQRRQKLIKAFYYLRKTGRVEFRQKGSDYEIRLTSRGKKYVKRLALATVTVTKADRWDGKFWQIAADIPTKDHRRGADALRQKLKDMGFYPLQRTLWFYPYDPRLELEFITRHFGIAPFVTVMKIAELDPSDEQALVKYFKKQRLI